MLDKKTLLFGGILVFTIFLAGCLHQKVPAQPPNNEIDEFYRINNTTAAEPDVWYNVSWQVKENYSEGRFFVLDNDNETIVIKNFNGLVRVQGTLHPSELSSSTQYAQVRGRITRNGEEIISTQVSRNKEFKSNSIDTLPILGVFEVERGDKLNLEWRTSNTNIELNGCDFFDKPVAATMNIKRIGR